MKLIRKIILLIVVLIIVVFLVMALGCTTKPAYDRNYGIMFSDEMVHITIRTDYKKSGEILQLYITNEESDGILEKTEGINTDLSKEDEAPITYYVQHKENGKNFERIVINFYLDGFDTNNAEEVMKYLGLNLEYFDGLLLYDELKKAENFIYKNVITNDDKITNISFNGDAKYEFNE